jgi:pantetheine-phosphate adenylyltransferase
MVRAVYPGSFDPIHFGHIDIARRAARLFDELVVAVYDRPIKNLLFSPEERIAQVTEAFKNDGNIRVVGYRTLTVSFCRAIDAQVIVRGLRVFSDFELEFRMALANKHLDPGIEVVALITNQKYTFLSSSTVREIASLGGDISGMVPRAIVRAVAKKFNDPKNRDKVSISLKD